MDPAQIAVLIPMFGIFALFVVPGIIGLIAIRLWFRSRDRLYQTIDAAIDKGAPPEVINQLVEMTRSKEDKEEKKPVIKHLSEGALFLAAGVALLLFFFNGGPTGTIVPGVFGTLFGLIKFGIAAVAAKRSNYQGE